MIRAVLCSAEHPEYGDVTVPLPIPKEEYDHAVELLASLEIGDARERDCYVREIRGGWPILHRLEKLEVNVDELDYLARRLDGFDVGESAQFQGTAVKLGIFEMTDLINLSFCCQQATVITDFSNLDAIGRSHLLNLNGGTMPTAELDGADARAAAMQLILSGEGTVTPYGVVYDNGMSLERIYDGQHLPAYLYEPCVMTVEVRPVGADADERGEYFYLPAARAQLARAMCRAGIDAVENAELRFVDSELPEEADAAIPFERETLHSLNELCAAVDSLDRLALAKLGAAVQFAKPESAAQIQRLAENLDDFDFVPGAATPEDYGRYMIASSGHFEYDDNLAEYYDFGKYGRARIAQEQGEFNTRGYVSYRGTMRLQELMADVPPHDFGGLQME